MQEYYNGTYKLITWFYMVGNTPIALTHCQLSGTCDLQGLVVCTALSLRLIYGLPDAIGGKTVAGGRVTRGWPALHKRHGRYAQSLTTGGGLQHGLPGVRAPTWAALKDS